MIDPLAVAVGVSLLIPVLGGPLLVRGLALAPADRRRTIEWVIILGAVGAAILAAVLQDRPVASRVLTYVLPGLPALITFLVWRSQLASALISLAPMYFLVAILTRHRVTYRPELALDRAIPVEPAWMIVYGSLYVFVVVLPLLVVRERDLIRRAMKAYLLVMLVSYAGFLLYPTAAPRADDLIGDGFAAWTLRLAYALDPPFNCFPSLHVAYAFVSALACYGMHRGVGIAAMVWATLISISTLFTKQHYVADVIAGAAAAGVAYIVFLRHYSLCPAAVHDRERAPRRAAVAVAMFVLMVAAFWTAYRLMH